MLDAHVHLERGPYTLAWVERFAAQAGLMGIDRLYSLEHTHNFVEFSPLYRRVDVVSPMVGDYQRAWLERRLTRKLEDYWRLVEAIKQADWPLEIKCGLEICYFPGEEEVVAEVTAAFPWDFLTGSVHWLDGWGFDHPAIKYSWRDRDVDAVYARYYEVMGALLDSGLFDHLAHPESIKCFGYKPAADFSGARHEIAVKAAQHKVKVEYNNGLRVNYGLQEPGLSRDFLQNIKRAGAQIITASDAHRPEDVGRFVRKSEAEIG